ncbi:MAG TPA: 6-phosphogluconolactonase [Actinomycetota bacterium]
MLERELRVVDDVAEEALAIFLAAAPKTVVLSGGGTPEAFYRRLAGAEYAWEEVEFFFGDERCVSREDQWSNARMADEALFSKVPARSYAMDGQGCDAEWYERMLRRRFGEDLLFDLALYGLGPDGHTASLFPGRPEVEVTDRWVVHVREAGLEPFVPRISLTVPALSAAKLGVFLVAGVDKQIPLRRLMAGEDLPAARLKPERLVILADRAAAGS